MKRLLASLDSLLLFSLVAMGLLALTAGTAGAQSLEPAGLTNVHVWVNPEYDDPRLLVMMEGQITGSEPPTAVRFLVPHEAVMYSAGSMDAQGKYTGGPPDRKSSTVAGWDEISYQITSDRFRVEYYYDAIKGFPDKTISCDVRWPYPVSGLNVFVQQPRNATNFVVTPAGGQAGVDADGLDIQTYIIPSVDKDTLVHFDIAYTRTDTNPSIGSPSTPTGPPTEKSNTGLLVGVLAGVAVLVAAGVLWATRSRPAKQAARSRAGGRAARGPFCSQCGRRLDHPSRFCPYCGASQE